MIDALFNQPNFLAAKRLLDATALRHEAITSNLGHLETPGYQRVDVSPAFESELKQAIESRDVSQLKSMSPRLEVDRTAIPQRRDGNTVDLESELVRLNRNGVEHAVETQLVTGALLKLRLAITGRAG